MALTAYTRFRFLWGSVDWQQGTGNPYASGQTGSLGASAVASGGIGVRRVQCVIDRSTAHAGADVAVMHFDILNITSGSPDDTWTTTDFTQCETALDAFFAALVAYWSTGYKLTTYNWYRVGEGVTKPNPAVRQLVKGTPIVGTSAGHLASPQTACSITFRTAVRRSWGRTYLPAPQLSGNTAGVITTGNVDAIAGAANTLTTALAANDFYLVVTSKKLHAALNVERVEVDDVLDVIRRRRWKASTYKKLLP